MRFWKPQLVLGLAAAAVLALAVTLFVRRGLVDVVLVIVIGAALVGMYLLRRYARAELLYLRHADHRRRASRPDRPGSGHPVSRIRTGQPIVRS
jgi:hypothetical protein